MLLAFSNVKRVVVLGSSGSGKTFFAQRLSSILGLPHLELDSVFHRGGWSSTPDDQFQQEVETFAEARAWVVDGNYTSHGTQDVLWPLADTFVWLDPPKRTVMWRVIKRTLKRVVTREELWDGVTEPWTNLYSLDPYQNIIVWAWTRFEHTRSKYETAIADGTWGHAEVHRLRTAKEAERFLHSVYESTLTEQ